MIEQIIELEVNYYLLICFITFFSMACGSLLLNISSPKNFEPFILISLLLSIALIPILLIKRKAPQFKKITPIKIKELYNISPMGVFTSFCTGLIHSAIFSLTAVYAAKMNFNIFEISLLIFSIIISGAFFQWPLGYLSDKINRRTVIIYSSIAAFYFWLSCNFFCWIGTRSYVFSHRLEK